MILRFFVCTLTVSMLSTVAAQQQDVYDLDEQQVLLIENFIENADGQAEFDYNTLFDDLKTYLKKPLNLNEAEEEDLKQLYFLNDLQIADLLEHRRRHGAFLSMAELQAIPSLDLRAIRTIRPFVTVNESLEDYHYPLLKMLSTGDNEVYIKWRRILEDQIGYSEAVSENSRYLGDPNRLYIRYKHAYENRLQYGFTAEKDAGETFFSGDNDKGFDFYSAHLYARNLNRFVKAFAIGDYSISLGQGLILHNQFGASKTSFVMDIKKSGRVIKPYSSVNEVNFFRGGAITLKPSERIQTTVFGSAKKVDGTVNVDSLGEDFFGEFSSLLEDGYHRSVNEIGKEGSIGQQSVGGQVQVDLGRLRLGLNGLYEHFDQRFTRSDQLYNLFAFSGHSIWNTSVDYTWRLANFNLFGEVARSDNDGYAQLHGVLIGIDPKLALSVLYRKYDADYQVINANAFAESSGTANEEGIYFGLELRPHTYWSLNAYVDFWKHPWLRFRRDAPSTGREYLAKVTYYRKRKVTAYVQYKYEEKNLNTSADVPIDQLGTISLHRLRLHVSHKLSKPLELRNRVEFSFFDRDGNSSNGFLIFQDVIYKPTGSPFSATARFALFDTDSFDSRIYAYENDLIYEFFIPFYQNRGSRFYVNLRYNVSRNLTTEFRFAQTYLENRETVGSGLNTINGNVQTDLKAQIRLSF